MNGEKLEVVLFSGGRGTTSITEALLKHPQISLTLVVNTYDDGLSTGRIRAFVPGLLGPSDVRKCFTRVMPETDRSDRALREVLELRLPQRITAEQGMRLLDEVAGGSTGDTKLGPLLDSLRVDQAKVLSGYVARFRDYARAQAIPFDFTDCCFGNIAFAGCYFEHQQDFNAATDAFGKFVRARGRVLNVTDGENLVLVGLKDDGSILANESAIVAPQSRVPIRDIYLLKEYLAPEELKRLSALAADEIHAALQARAVTPRLNPECRDALLSADIIVYGPGTQHSSLFPSYLTDGLAEAIRDNAGAEKIFVGNIVRDNEIQAETAESLAQKFLHYMSRKGQSTVAWLDVVTTFFVQNASGVAEKAAYLPFAKNAFKIPVNSVVGANWESQRGEHLGGRVVDEIVSIANLRVQRKLQPFRYMVSIIVPGLNEARTVQDVLRGLTLVDFSHLGLGKEIIYVDGGSTDGSFELAQQVRGVQCIKLEGATGRGLAMRTGAERAAGNILVFFPSDGEYTPSDVPLLVEPVARNQFRAVFGSRTVKVQNLSAHMRQIYGGDRFGYLIGKYGGMTLSVASLVLLNRYVSDPLTGLKVMDAHLFRELALSADGLDFEGELIAKLGRRGEFILEIPVNFRARRREDGKKSTIVDGLKALSALMRHGLG